MLDSKSSGSDTVRVRPPPPAPSRGKRDIACPDFFTKVASHSFCRSSFQTATAGTGLWFGFLMHGYRFPNQNRQHISDGFRYMLPFLLKIILLFLARFHPFSDFWGIEKVYFINTSTSQPKARSERRESAAFPSRAFLFACSARRLGKGMLLYAPAATHTNFRPFADIRTGAFCFRAIRRRNIILRFPAATPVISPQNRFGCRHCCSSPQAFYPRPFCSRANCFLPS